MKLRWKCMRLPSFLLNCCFHLLIFFLMSASSSSTSRLSDNSLSGDIQKLDPVMVRMLETNLLKALGMKSRPRPDRTKTIISDPMLELYYQQTGQNARSDVQHWQKSRPKPGRIADTVRSFHPTYGPEEEDVWREGGGGHRQGLAFDMTGLPRDDDIKAAEVKIFLNQSWAPEQKLDSSTTKDRQSSPADQSNQRFIIRVHEVLQRIDGEAITRQIDSKLVDVSNGSKWATFDILPAVQRWQSDSSANQGLELEVLTPSGQPLYHEHLSPLSNQLSIISPIRYKRSVARNSTTSPVEAGKQPVMLVHSNEAKSKAPKSPRRPAQQRPPGARHTRNLCQRIQLHVEFGDVQWTDWIVAPTGYNAFACAGECSYPMPDHLNSTNHAVVQSLVHHSNSANRGAPAAPNPCCVPTELSPISLLYIDEYDKVTLKNYQDMVVEGCGCR